MSIISVKKLSIHFNHEVVIDDLSFEVFEGEKVAIKGESGAGKTTLLNILMGFVQPEKGEISLFSKSLNAENISEIRAKIAWVPQELNLPVNSVRDLVTLPFSYKRNKELKPADEEIQKIFDDLGLKKSTIDKNVSEISGGEKQRVVLAISLLLKREIIFLDEPTSSLDKESKKKIMEYFLHNPGLTILSTSHDEEWINNSGKIIELNSH